MLDSLDITRSALTAQRTRLDVIAGNIANASATQQEDGTVQPYRRRFVTFASGDAATGGPGVHVSSIEQDQSPFPYRHDPGHPHANAAGYVAYPNVSLSKEYVDALEASRAYELNVAMMNVTRQMLQRSISLLA